MLELSPRLSLRATYVGPVAARVLRDGARGVVRAVFERSLYAGFVRGLVCIGPPGLGNGPLNLLCVGWSTGRSLAELLAVDRPATVRGNILLVGSALTVALAGADHWLPKQPKPWNAEQLARGLAIASACLPHDLPAEGLARLLIPDEDTSPIVAMARRPADYLTLCVRRTLSGDDGQVDALRLASLLGLGPGLTPSGDDYLGGALVALAHLGLRRLRGVIWSALAPLVPAATSEISVAHLRAAAEGFGNAALHDLLEAIVAADAQAMRDRIAAVVRIGHTSGWDAMAGALDVLSVAANGERFSVAARSAQAPRVRGSGRQPFRRSSRSTR